MRRGAQAAVSGTFALLLAGCHPVGPDYHLPDEALSKVPTATGAFVGSTEQAVTATTTLDRWWVLYDDKRLNDLVRQALAANTDLRVAGANIARARAALAGAEDARLPQTKAIGAFEYGQVPGEEFLQPRSPPAAGLYDTEFDVGYQIDLFGQIARAIEAAKADVDAAREANNVVRLTVAADTVRAFVEACAAGHELAVARHSLDLQQQSFDLTSRLTRAGRATALDVTRSQAQVEQFRANIPSLEAEHRVALYRLAVLTGRPPAEFPKSVDGCAAEPQLSALIPVGDGEGLIRRRPDISQAERQLAAATARIGVAVADLYPKINFGLSLGSTGLINDFLSGPTMEYGVGPLISWDFPQQNAARARIAGAEAATQAAFATFDGKVLGALRETESALTVYGRDLDRRTALKAARTRAQQATDQSDQLYSAGRLDALSNLDAHRVLAAADQSLAQGDTKVALDQVTLFLALGGGWQQDTPPPAATTADATTAEKMQP
jgi:NodT family efflux transporter outer membrane factor (OMF) lipoprotein